MAAYHVAGPDPHRDPRLLPPAAPSDHSAGSPDDLRRCLFGGRKRHRRAGLPLPINRTTALSDRDARAVSTLHVILEDIVHYTLSNLHNIQKSLLYWNSRAEGTNVQRMYFVIFERGPRAFLETTWQALTGLRSKSPSQYLLNSAAKIVSTKLDFLTSIQDCLAAFLAEVYSEVDKCKGGLTESSDQWPHALSVVLNTVFLNLELSLRNLLERQTPDLTTRFFERLPEVDVESSIAANLIYKNLLRLDIVISNKLAVHKKPRNKTIYWLPYTCGAIGLSACSLWLLRHSSFMGSSDRDGSIRDAKGSVAGYWDQHAVELIISIRDGLYETFKRTNKLISTKQGVHQIEASLHRDNWIVLILEITGTGSFAEGETVGSTGVSYTIFGMARFRGEHINRKPNQNNSALAELLGILGFKFGPEFTLWDARAMQELTQILEGNEIKFALCAAWPAFGLCLLLFLLVRALVFHDQDEEGRGKMSRLPQRLLLRDAELRLMEFQKCITIGMEKKAESKFGLMLCDLDRLYRIVEFHAKKTGEWSSVREDIVDLAKPHMRMADRLVVLSRLKEMYYCLLPSPSPSMCYPPSS